MSTINARNGHPLTYFPTKLNIFGRFLWKIYCIDIFPDADATSFIYNKWHPLSYILLVITIFLIILMGGIVELRDQWKLNKIGFGYTKYWKENPDRIEFIPRNIKED